MREGYARERVWKAVDCLATSAASIQQRVANAGLELAPLRPDDFPDVKSRASFAGIMDTLTHRDAEGDEGTIAATAARLSDDQALRLADQIFDLDGTLRPL